MEMVPLILAEGAKMEGSPSTLWGWPKYIPLINYQPQLLLGHHLFSPAPGELIANISHAGAQKVIGVAMAKDMEMP